MEYGYAFNKAYSPEIILSDKGIKKRRQSKLLRRRFCCCLT